LDENLALASVASLRDFSWRGERALIFAEPAIAAYFCPACYGFQQAAPHVFIESTAKAPDVARIKSDFAAARERLLGFYPDLRAQPKWLFCVTDTCQNRVGGQGPLAMAYLNFYVQVSPKGQSVPILTHEMAHAELKARICNLRYLRGAVPAWFDEGLAVYLSRDTRFLQLEGGTVIGCRAKDLPDPAADSLQFRHLAATQTFDLYTASACNVVDWLAVHNSAQGVIAMEDSMRSGGAFNE